MSDTKLFKTTVVGVGPYCIEFPDGEIITTRSEGRQKQIADYATLEAECRWAMEQVAKGREQITPFITRNVEDGRRALAHDPVYQRATAWLAGASRAVEGGPVRRKKKKKVICLCGALMGSKWCRERGHK